MIIHVRLRIKFRFLFKDLYTMDKQWALSVIDGWVRADEEPVSVPSSAKVIYDNRGVKLNAW